MTPWKTIETAPKDGSPIWARGYDYGEKKNAMHYCWAWFDGKSWRASTMTPEGQAVLSYLVEWVSLSDLCQAPNKEEACPA